MANVVLTRPPKRTVSVIAPIRQETQVQQDSVESKTINLPGVQGPPGAQNLFVGPTPPENPQEGYVWIDTS